MTRTPESAAAGEMQAAPPGESAASLVGLVDARDEAAWQWVGGISLVTRLVRSLELEGVAEIVVVCGRKLATHELAATRPQTRLATAVLEPDAPFANAELGLSPATHVLFVDGSLVVDRRLLAALARARVPTRVPTPPTDGIRLARLPAGDLARDGEGVAWRVLETGDLPTFDLKMRGDQEVLLRDVSTPAAAEEAETLLIERTQKAVMDWPARWIDPPVENALVGVLAPTRIGPDGVTLIGAALAIGAAVLLWHGWLVSALPLMLGVGWLDGVDGKLARIRLRGGWFGEHEAVVDFFVENAWYVALGAWFHGTSHPDTGLLVAGVLIVANIVDESSYTLAGIWLGRSLDLLTPADGAFRLVAGRRNIYVWYLVVAFLAGFAWEGFVLCAAWAAVTAVVHAVRLVIALVRGEGQK